jgi:hypothetical protein
MADVKPSKKIRDKRFWFEKVPPWLNNTSGCWELSKGLIPHSFPLSLTSQTSDFLTLKAGLLMQLGEETLG